MAVVATGASEAVEAARTFFTAYNAHDIDKMLAACSDSAQLRYMPMGNQGLGNVRDVGKTIWSGIIDAFPDLHVTVQSMFGNAENVAAEVVIGGTQSKDFLNIPNRGKHYELPHAFLLEVDGVGKITSIAAYWDNASFYLQLGKTALQ
ncbi:MAG: ester cyclase [Rhodomicrobium sp.]